MKLVTGEKLQEFSSKEAKYQRIDNFKLSEPRIEMIHNRIRALLRVVQLESGGKPVEVNGFRLKNLEQWTSKVGPPFSDLWYISTACNMRCPFCYEEGDPFEGSVLNEPSEMLSLKELETRLKYRDKENGTGLFQPLTYINEIFCHPKAMEVIRRIRREYPDEILTFVTNGTYLTEDVIQELAGMKPIFFNFSVNSLDIDVRKKILRDPAPEVAIEAIQLLKKYKIPYLGSLVCWPTIPWSDIENTCRVLDEGGCSMIRFSLSAYSKFLKGKKFERIAFWNEGIAVAKQLISKIETPIKIEPYHYVYPTYEPLLAGVIVNSPAWKKGLKAEDRILTINGKKIPTANHALTALAAAYTRHENIVMECSRGQSGECFSVELEYNTSSGYPFEEMKHFKGFEYGLIIVDTLKFGYLREMRALIDLHKANNVLVCSSEIMKPIVTRMIDESKAFSDIKLDIEVPANKYFGGTVVLGDLLVVQDYIDFINAYVKDTGKRPDLIIIPSSPFSRGEWMRDLQGRPFTDIERFTGLPVRLVYCQPING